VGRHDTMGSRLLKACVHVLKHMDTSSLINYNVYVCSCVFVSINNVFPILAWYNVVKLEIPGFDTFMILPKSCYLFSLFTTSLHCCFHYVCKKQTKEDLVN
jgi:hypothetical protein